MNNKKTEASGAAAQFKLSVASESAVSRRHSIRIVHIRPNMNNETAAKQAK